MKRWGTAELDAMHSHADATLDIGQNGREVRGILQGADYFCKRAGWCLREGDLLCTARGKFGEQLQRVRAIP